MSERKPGWYWAHVYGNWEPAYTDDGDVFDHIDSRVDKVGPRIPTPDEMERWQLVPRAPTPDMLENGVDMLDVTDSLIPTYQAMLWVAPKPEDS